jgi:hypothetical protein
MELERQDIYGQTLSLSPPPAQDSSSRKFVHTLRGRNNIALYKRRLSSLADYLES